VLRASACAPTRHAAVAGSAPHHQRTADVAGGRISHLDKFTERYNRIRTIGINRWLNGHRKGFEQFALITRQEPEFEPPRDVIHEGFGVHGSPATVIAAIRQTIHDVYPRLPISDVMTLDQQVARSITNQRLAAQLSAFFGLLAVLVSCIGIYGLMSYMVMRRPNDIGIRMALGADRFHVRRLRCIPVWSR
jgi:hypothetical protein